MTLPEDEIPLAVYVDGDSSSHECTVVTDSAVYQCAMRQNPEDLCRQLLLEVGRGSHNCGSDQSLISPFFPPSRAPIRMCWRRR